jgi:hypothetical protein
MAEVVSEQPAAATENVSYLADAPPIRTLDDGNKLLAEATAFLVRGCRELLLLIDAHHSDMRVSPMFAPAALDC